MSYKRAKNISETKQKLKGSFLVSNPFEWTTKQENILSILNDKNTKCFFIEGPAGVGKTQLAIYSALQHLQSRCKDKLIYIRSIVESSNQSMGYLPGDLNDKQSPFMQVLEDKLEDMLAAHEIDELKKSNRIETKSPNFLRGKDFKNTYIIVDEAQNFTFEELVLIISRIGDFSKIVFLFDPNQSDLKRKDKKNDIVKFSSIFNTEKSKLFGIHFAKFLKSDILRSDFCKFVMDEIENYLGGSQE